MDGGRLTTGRGLTDAARPPTVAVTRAAAAKVAAARHNWRAMTARPAQTPPPATVAGTARAQHTALARTTAGRIRRYAEQVIADLDGGGAVTVHGQQIAQAALTLLAELVAMATRDEIAARAAREAAA